MKLTAQQESKILSKFEKYKGYDASLFDGEGWRESDAYEAGYLQALEDLNINKLKEFIEDIGENLELQLSLRGVCGQGNGKDSRKDADGYGGSFLLEQAKEMLIGIE